jgi:hypothetical protein
MWGRLSSLPVRRTFQSGFLEWHVEVSHWLLLNLRLILKPTARLECIWQ